MEDTYLIVLRYNDYDFDNDCCTTYDLPVTTVVGEFESDVMLDGYQEALPEELEDVFCYYKRLIPSV